MFLKTKCLSISEFDELFLPVAHRETSTLGLTESVDVQQCNAETLGPENLLKNKVLSQQLSRYSQKEINKLT